MKASDEIVFLLHIRPLSFLRSASKAHPNILPNLLPYFINISYLLPSFAFATRARAEYLLLLMMHLVTAGALTERRD